MAELKFNTGVKSFAVNGVPDVFSINPTDTDFVERIFDTFRELDERQQKKDAEAPKLGDREAFELAREYDAEMRTAIDKLLGEGVCAKVFGGMNVYAYADGLPVWTNFMFALLDECDTAFAREQKATNPRLKKYLDKYKKK